jgi:hypothetical protein
LALATGGPELDSFRITKYLKDLKRDPAEEILAALGRLARTARFFPSVAEIVAEMQAARGDSAEMAWQTAIGLARSEVGKIREAYGRDGRLEVAIRSLGGGIAVIRDRTMRDEPYLRARFLAAYRGATTLPEIAVPDDARRVLR